MDSYKDSDYCYANVLLYPPGNFPKRHVRPNGTAEIELMGNKGWLNCRTKFLGRFLEKHPEFELVAFLYKEAAGEKFRIGRINVGENGSGFCTRSFADSGLKVEKLGAGETAYKLLITARSEVQEVTVSKVLFEGSFKISFEIRDDRVVGFKKEAKDEKTANQQFHERNPLFQKVEPFQPPIPNSMWWQISIQPVYDYGYMQRDYCPRRKSNKAVF